MKKKMGHIAWQHDSLALIHEIIGRMDDTQMVTRGNKLLNKIPTPCEAWIIYISNVLVLMLAENLAYLDTRVTLDLGS